MDSNYDMTQCAICHQSFDSTTSDQAVDMTTDQRSALQEACVRRSDDELSSFLTSNPDIVRLHEDCHKRYMDLPPDEMKHELDSERNETALEQPITFDWNTLCFLCGKNAKNLKHANRYGPISKVVKDRVEGNILEICRKRKDEWSEAVEHRLKISNGQLHKLGAIYHRKCRNKFQISRSKSGRQPARPVNEIRMSAFENVCSKFEKAEFFTLGEFMKEMRDLSGDPFNIYSLKHTKTKLHLRYGKNLLISDAFGLKNVLYLRNSKASLLVENEKECEVVSCDDLGQILFVE